jgi:hypothetical protein
MESFAELVDAEAAADAAIRRIATGEQQILELTNNDRLTYLRAQER